MDDLLFVLGSVGISDEQRRPAAAKPQGMIPLFVVYVAILGDNHIRIVEHSFGRLETDSVLLKIAFRFLRPPSEFDPHLF